MTDARRRTGRRPGASDTRGRILEAARARGLDVTANQYPYTAMQHQWASFFPLWAREGGPDKFAAILRDPAQRKKIKEDKDFQTWVMEHGGWDGIVLGRARRPEIKKYEGMRIAQIAKKYNLLICTFGHAGNGNLHPTCPTDARNAGSATASTESRKSWNVSSATIAGLSIWRRRHAGRYRMNASIARSISAASVTVSPSAHTCHVRPAANPAPARWRTASTA